MFNIAVAGGLGKVGRTVVEVLREDVRYNVYVMSRKLPKSSENSDAPVMAVDYQDIGALTVVLESIEIHTVVSCLSVMSEAAGQAQINLIKAATASSSTRRIILSEWGLPYSPEATKYMPHLKYRMNAVMEASKSGLQFTRYFNGYFLDYYGLPDIKSHLVPVAFAVDMENKVAGIPGTGNEPVTFSYSYDVAKFVRESLTLSTWPEESIVIGDKITWNEFLSLAEEVRGCKFDVHYDSIQKLNTFQITELPSHLSVYPNFPREKLQYVFAVFGLWMATGLADLPVQGSLNRKFPEIRTLTVKEMLEQAWKGK